MLLESSIQRTKSFGNSLKMSESANISLSGPYQDRKSLTLSINNTEASANNNGGLPTVVQCYSVSTGKVSTLLRSPSQSSISSIEVAEINHLSEFRNTMEHEHIAAITSVPQCVINKPTFETSALVDEAFDVENFKAHTSSSLSNWPLIYSSNDTTKR